ncbi:helix-turn-helix domain-containing protein [Caulobacter hibisci]|uniref:Chromosomal replication initiator DnaA C-terminal domain-containing protein n=1 Tax=Caulobacter hibisci TaxID=2035993 RepID=A0ABS0SS81_9CAUL|nr:helix-turn-helix domain-containing protein [Caulobacter hibisci]MBI1682359.1 hypothetical protein [Caulobacter hibisci]
MTKAYPTPPIPMVELPVPGSFSLWKGSITGVGRITMPIVLEAVSGAYGVSVEELRGPKRQRRISLARQHAMWLMNGLPHLSLPMIGRFLNRDHTTVLFGIRAHERRVAEQAGWMEAA